MQLKQFLQENILFIIGVVLAIPFATKILFLREIVLPIQVLGEFVLLFLLIKRLPMKIKMSAEHYFLGCFLIISLLSIAITYINDGFITITSVLSFIRYISFIMLYFVGLVVLCENGSINRLIDGLIVGAAISSVFIVVYLLYLVYQGELLLKSHQVHNGVLLMQTFHGYPNKLSALYGTILVLMLYRKDISKLVVISALLIGTMLFFAMGKASLIGLGVSLVMLIILRFNKLNFYLGRIVAVYLVTISVAFYFTGYFNSNTQSILPRLQVTAATVQSISSSPDGMSVPLLGHGYKAVQNVLPTINYRGKVMNIGSSHNQYVEVLLKTGFIGLLSFCAFLFVIILKTLRHFFKNSEDYDGITWAITCILIGFLLSNFSQENFTAEPVASVSFLFLGYLSGRVLEEKRTLMKQRYE